MNIDISSEDLLFIVNDLIESAERAWDTEQFRRLQRLANQISDAMIRS